MNYRKYKRLISICALIFTWISIWTPQNIFSQTGGIKYSTHYKPNDYSLHPQNYWIIQDKRGIIYVGNNGGLLEFDGVSWRTIPIKNWTVRSMAIDDTGTIYIGGNGEIGYLESSPIEPRVSRYVSLLPFLDEDKKTFSNVWKTYWTKSGIYFQSSELLFRWNPHSKQMKVFEPKKDSRFFFSFAYNEKIFIRQQNVGLMQIVGNSLEVVPGGEGFIEKKIYLIAPYGNDSQIVLIGTQAHGFYLFDGLSFKQFPTEADEYLKEKKLYHGIRLSATPDQYALATLHGGIVIIDSDGKLKQIINRNSGLLDNNVKYIFEDIQGNLWLGLNKGISKIEYASAFSLYDERSQLPGLVLSIVKHQNALYAGTTEGLFRLDSSDIFHPVRDISSNCWSLLPVGDSLLIGTSEGVLQVGSTNTRKPIEWASYILHRSNSDANRVWVGTEHGLASLKLNPIEGNWERVQFYKEVKTPVWTIYEEKDGDLWMGTLNQGVFKVDFANDANHPIFTRYHTEHGLPAKEIHVFKAAGHAMFATEKGIFRFDPEKDAFIPDITVGEELANGSRNVFRIAEDRNKNIWIHSKARNIEAVFQTNKTYVLLKKPFRRMPITQVNNIYPAPDGNIVWFGSNEGLFRYDTQSKKNYEINFSTIIRNVIINGTPVFNGFKDTVNNKSNDKLSFPLIQYRDRNMRFEFAAPFFEAENETKYQWLLEGYDNQWSDWSSETKKDYTNLNSGQYTFRVHAKNVYEHLSSEDTFQFKILPPWHKTWWAFLIYGLLSLLMMFFVVKWRSGKLEREKKKLEQIVAERTKELDERTNEIKDKNVQLESQTVQLKEQSEELQEMAKIKSRFFANISHEFRTPLTLIMGPIEQMLSQKQEQEEEKQLNGVLRNSQRLLTLINQLLDLSRFDSGKVHLHAIYQDIIPFLKGILASFDSLAAQNKIHLQFSSEAEEVFLFFDPEKMEEIICNLLANAVKFTPAEGTITISVKTNPLKGEMFPEGFLEISVCDTGIGIAHDQLPYIFDRFYKAKSTENHNLKGTGIGLALTKELVNLHHGQIEVQSSEGKGTEFIIRLPLGKKHLKEEEIAEHSDFPSIRKKPGEISALYIKAKAEKDNVAIDGKQYEEDNEHSTQEKNVVLVVEDNDEVRKYIREPLSAIYTVKEAINGREGIDMAKSLIPDLIISDIMMPEVDGYELCNTLKKDVKTSHIPIILLTAKASEESVIEGLETGADDYITKPFNTKILATRVKNLIDLRQQLQEKIQRQMLLQPAEISVSSVDQLFIKELLAMIEKNLSDPEFNVEVLSKKLYMNRATLYRKIMALTGESPNQFIRSYRLKRAAQLLRDKFGNVSEVSLEVGFSNMAYFAKCFKEKFHQLPSTYHAAESQ